MTNATYTYRILVPDAATVTVEKKDPKGNSLGEPSGRLHFAEEQQNRIATLKDKAAYRASNQENALTEDEIKELGTALWDVLFDEKLKNDLLLFYNDIVHNRHALLRLELDVDEEKLPFIASLPWEFLYVPSNQITGELWLATSPQVIFSRRRRRWVSAQPIQLLPGEKLRITIVVSTPRDENLGKVDYQKLYKELQELAAKLTSVVDLVLIDPEKQPATRETIDKVLERKPHIFHFIGHGQFSKRGEQDVGEIAVVQESGLARWVTANQFSGLFTRHKPSVVFLQACEGGQLSSSTAFAGIASQIVQQNIPVVLAMQYEVSNATARRFAREFYTRLAAGEPVDKAAQEGRHLISDWHETRDFATPVLFMRVADGQLFSRPVGVEARQTDSATPVAADTTAGATAQIPATADALPLPRLIAERFDLQGIRALCFALGIDFDDLGSPGKSGKAQDLFGKAERLNRLDTLIRAMAAENPTTVTDIKANLYVFIERLKPNELMEICQQMQLDCAALKLDPAGLLGYEYNKHIRVERARALQDNMVANGRYPELVQTLKKYLPGVDLSIFEM